ncbi:hypothetical protein FE257_005801 [Aspergillus nanangensis]|uniref:Uncharacterized protein n=1 Tax=Aspergillus nanangensis TaxID=2582783 RepID=A0AAD4CA42_ASPNN|nr:hypothetical protein FE257_005801 [Aspergillus nanangensis]
MLQKGTASLNGPNLVHEVNILELMHNASTPEPMDPSKLRLGSFKNAGVIGRFTGCCYPIQFTAAPPSLDYCSRRLWPNRFVLAPGAAVEESVAAERYYQVINTPFRVREYYELARFSTAYKI